MAAGRACRAVVKIAHLFFPGRRSAPLLVPGSVHAALLLGDSSAEVPLSALGDLWPTRHGEEVHALPLLQEVVHGAVVLLREQVLSQHAAFCGAAESAVAAQAVSSLPSWDLFTASRNLQRQVPVGCSAAGERKKVARRRSS